MKTRTRQVLLIIATQTACLGVGLWMQYHYVSATVLHAASQRCYGDLVASAADLTDELSLPAFHSESVALDGGSVDDQGRLLDAVQLRYGEVLMVDADWRLRFSSNARYPLDDRDSNSASVEWRPVSDEVRHPSTWSKGLLTLSDGEHFAVAHRLPGRAGFVFVHHPAAEIQENVAAFVHFLPAISLMTLLWMSVFLSIAVYILWAHLHDDMDEQRSRSASESVRQVQDLVRTRDAVIFGLAKLADSRDPETGDHLERISVYSTMLATAAASAEKFSREITPIFVRLIGISSALHDIGKVGISDSILLKPGRLTPEEYAEMQDHARIGADCLREIERRLGSSNFLQLAREIALSHHENWDGSGYPRGLAGTNIPLAARIVAIADVYDALSSKRVYKEAFSHEKCVELIRKDAAKKFDPDLVEVWIGIERKFETISRQLTNRGDSAASEETFSFSIGDSGERKLSEYCGATSGSPTQPEHAQS